MTEDSSFHSSRISRLRRASYSDFRSDVMRLMVVGDNPDALSPSRLFSAGSKIPGRQTAQIKYWKDIVHFR